MTSTTLNPAQETVATAQPTLSLATVSGLDEPKVSTAEPVAESSISSASSTTSVSAASLLLPSAWTLYFDCYMGRGHTPEEYAANLLNVCTVCRVDAYWRWLNHLPPPARLRPGSSYHFMRHNVLPLWEHSQTVDGGQLQFRVVRGPHADRLYQDLLVLLVCEQMHPPLHKDDRLVGLSASVRRTEVVISLWNAAACLLDQSALAEFVYKLLPEEGRVDDKPTYRVHRALADFRPAGEISREDVGSGYSARREQDTSSASPVRGPPVTPFLLAASRRTRSQPPNSGRGHTRSRSRHRSRKSQNQNATPVHPPRFVPPPRPTPAQGRGSNKWSR
eukprot:CAMPEP_0177639512 /NCGR_PEP_ID=MMETSP0447-20121125/6059_1 /TAXON_ID=0 /ORGANISM="Stygamoeba regulata, Strain BSH-02190019" /LENGTH=332 /DNA_ID=CAMNT_0019141541 /DNA_START=236 /DNA_END=1234 /DNA_ORIENTATION=-